MPEDDHITGDWGMDMKNMFSVYVGNLPTNATKCWIRGHFKVFGEISNIFILKKRKRSMSPTYAFV